MQCVGRSESIQGRSGSIQAWLILKITISGNYENYNMWLIRDQFKGCDMFRNVIWKPNMRWIKIDWDSLNLGKIYDMLKICLEFDESPVSQFLPIAQTQPMLQYVLYIANNSGT